MTNQTPPMIGNDDAAHALAMLYDHLSDFRFACLTEQALARGINTVLRQTGVTFERERWLPDVSGRLDFYLPDTRLFIESKVFGSWANVLRQLHLYCGSAEVAGGLLISRKAVHQHFPAELNGKPLRTLWVGAYV